VKKVYLRRLTIDDADFVLEIRNDESTRKFLDNHSIFTREDFRQWFASREVNWLVIVDFNTEEQVGYVRTDKDDGKSIEIGADIHKKHRRQGYATAAYEALFKYLKDRSYESVHLGVLSYNEAAKSLYDKLGFKTIGMRVTAANEESVVMSRNL
tara:strand:+ start:6653 stop:7114 length:462 start_codon:yes stop_codon:yes gene_type:complete